MEIDYELLARLIDDRRRERGLTQQDLAKMADLSERTVRSVMHGQRRMTMQTLSRILEALELSLDEIPRKAEPTARPKGKNIFISYSHRDREYLSRLMVHLKPLERQGLIDAWVDTRLMAGDKWKKEIEAGLKKARVAILLISADFLASDFIIENELPPLLHSAEEKGTLVIPVILKPCRFTREPTLREFQAINQPDEPLSLVDENERELIYDTIAQRIEDALDGG